MLYAALILVSGIAGALLTALFGKRRNVATGQPTPEEARITVEHNEARSKIEADMAARKDAIGKMTDDELENEINRDGW